MSFEQRKRVSIAIELSANPSILFLDEPTTGLDSRSAQIVTRNVRTIANSGRTIVCTMHQPSPQVFAAFDRLLLLQKGGTVVYFGPIGVDGEEVVKYFDLSLESLYFGEVSESIRGSSNRSKNPATWMLEVINMEREDEIESDSDSNIDREREKDNNGIEVSDSKREEESKNENMNTFHTFYLSSSLYTVNDNYLNTLISSLSISNPTHSISTTLSSTNGSFSIQAYTLLIRTWLNYWRNPIYSLYTRILMPLLLSLIFASVFIHFKCETISDAMALITILLMILVSSSVLVMLVCMPIAVQDRVIFYREQECHMYSVGVYTVIHSLVEIPFVVIGGLLLVVPFYYLVDLDVYDNTNESDNKLMYFWLFATLMLTFNVYYGQFLVSLAPTASTAHCKLLF